MSEEKDRLEAIEEIYDELEKGEEVEPEADETEGEEVSEVDTQEEITEEVEDGDAPEEASEPSEDAEETDVEESSQEVEASTEGPAAPEHWSPEDKEAFNSVPAEGREFLLKRYSEMEADFTRKTQEVAEQRKEVEPLLEATKRWDTYMSSLGITSAQAFETLASAEYTMRNGTPEQKDQHFAQLARDYGVDLQKLVPGHEGDLAEYNDPVVGQLKSELDGIKGQLQQSQQEQAALQQQQLQEQVEAFKNAKLSSGELAHPHFEDVRSEMAALANTNPSWDLETLYKKAVRLNDSVFEKVSAAEIELAKVQEQKRKQEAAAKAKKAAKVRIKSDTTKAKEKKPQLSGEELTSQIYDELAAQG